MKGAKQGSRVIALATVRGTAQTLEQIRWLPADATIVGHFAYLDTARKDDIRVILIDGALLEVWKDGIMLSADLMPGRLIYVEYKVDKVAEQNILRKIEVVFLDDEVVIAALNATYVIEGEFITLASGSSEKQAAPGSAITVKTLVWGTPMAGYLDNIGQKDAALILVHQAGGSGTLYYTVACYWGKEKGAYAGTNAILLGDRISPQNVSTVEFLQATAINSTRISYSTMVCPSSPRQ